MSEENEKMTAEQKYEAFKKWKADFYEKQIKLWAANEIERLHHLLNRVCVWTISPTDNKTLVGACGAEFKFVNDMPEDGDGSYCIHCGGRVKIPAPGDCPF